MKNISDLPNEILLQIFVRTAFPADILALTGTCKHFRELLEQNESSLSIDIAARVVSVPYRVLGFGGESPNFRGVVRLVHDEAEIEKVSEYCDNLRHDPEAKQHAIWRTIWFIPLWQEHFGVGMLLYKMISRSASPMETLVELPGAFHALLRFTSIMVWDMTRTQYALTFGKRAIRRMRRLVESSEAVGDKAPWLQKNLGWRETEIYLFEHGGAAEVIEMLQRREKSDWTEQSQLPREPEKCVFNLLTLGQLPPDRCYHLRLDDLCLAYGGVWGPADFWQQFDPFALKGSWLWGVDAMGEIVQHLLDRSK